MNVPASQTKRELSTLPFDPELTPGARNAVNVCLRIQPSEKVTVITDEATKEIAASIVHELEMLGAPYRAWILEELAPRPLTDLPREIVDDLETSQVSIFAVQAQANELRSRMQMTDVVNRRKIRHAHMVNINHQIMLEGMRADFLKVDRISTKVVETVRTREAGTSQDRRRDRSHRRSESGISLAQDQRHHQSRQMGKLARRRSVYHSRRGQWNVRDRWRRRRLALRQVWQPA